MSHFIWSFELGKYVLQGICSDCVSTVQGFVEVRKCLNNHSTACSDCNITIFVGKILIFVNEPSTEACSKFRFMIISLRDSRKFGKVHFVLRCRLWPESCEDFQHPSQKAETQATQTTLHVLGSISHPSHNNTVEQSYFIV